MIFGFGYFLGRYFGFWANRLNRFFGFHVHCGFAVYGFFVF